MPKQDATRSTCPKFAAVHCEVFFKQRNSLCYIHSGDNELADDHLQATQSTM